MLRHGVPTPNCLHQSKCTWFRITAVRKAVIYSPREDDKRTFFAPDQALAVKHLPLAQLLPAGAGPHGLGLAPLRARAARALLFLGLTLDLARRRLARGARSARTLHYSILLFLKRAAGCL